LLKFINACFLAPKARTARPTARLGVYLFLAVMDRTARNVSYLVENLKGAV